MSTGNASPFQPGDRVYFIGWTAPEGSSDDEDDERPEWATVSNYPSNDPERTNVVYDSKPGAEFPASTEYLRAAADAPEPDPRAAEPTP